MITYTNQHGELIRDFTKSQYETHINLVRKIDHNNDFGSSGVHLILKNYLNMIADLVGSDKAQVRRFTTNECIVYDLVVEIIRLCYKYSYNFGETNDWEAEFH